MAGRYTHREALQLVNRSNYIKGSGDDPNSVMMVAPPTDAWYEAHAAEAKGRKVHGNV
jgi:hypothetical protein